MAACRLAARRARGPPAGSRRRRVGGLTLCATARVGCGPLTRPRYRRTHRPGPNRRRGRGPVDGGVHRGVRPPNGIHRRPSGTTRRDVRAPWTVDIESREPLQPPRSPGRRFPIPPRRLIRLHPSGRGRFPMANRRTIRRAGRTQGRGCRLLHWADFGPIWPAGGAAGRGRRALRRGRAEGDGGGVAGGPVRWGGGTWRGRGDGPVGRGGWTWGRWFRWGSLGGTTLAAGRRCGAEPVAGGREWWRRWFRVARGGRRGPVVHRPAGGGRPRRRLRFPFASNRRSSLSNRLFLAPYRHRPRLSTRLVRSWTVRSPPTRPNGRARLRVAIDHWARLDLGVRPRHTRTRPIFALWTPATSTFRPRLISDRWARVASNLRTLLTLDPRTRPTFHFCAPVALLLRTRVGLRLRAQVVLGARACRGIGRPDRLVRRRSISVALPRPTRRGLVGRDRGPGGRGGRRGRPGTRGHAGWSGRVARSGMLAAGRRARRPLPLGVLGTRRGRRGRRTRSGRAGRSRGRRRRIRRLPRALASVVGGR
jgi:hypothetical protein